MEVKKVFEGRLKSMHDDLLAMQEDIKTRSKDMESAKTNLAMKKKEIGKDGDPMEIKDTLIEAQSNFYVAQLVDMNIRHLLSKMSEIVVLCGLFGVKTGDLEVEDEVKATLKDTTDGIKDLFKSEKVKMVVADKETYDFLMKSFNDNASKEESIKRGFESIQVQ